MSKTPQKNRVSTNPSRRMGYGVVAVLLIAGIVWICRPYSTAQLEAKATEALKKGDLSVAEGWLRRLQRRRPTDITVLEVLADVAYRQGRQRDCLDWLALAAEQAPHPPSAFVAVGTRAFEYHLPTVAERLHRRAIGADAQFLPAYGALARLFLATQQPSALRMLIAEADQRHVELQDDPVLLWLWIAGVRGRWSDSEARDWLRESLKAQPDDPILLAALSRLAAQSSPDEVEKLWTEHPGETPQHWPVQLVRAEHDLSHNHRRECLARLKSFPEASHRDARTWLVRARLLGIEHDPKLTLDLIDEALRIDPFLVEAKNLRGQLLARLDRDADAQREFHHAAQTDQLIQQTLQLMQQSPPAPGAALRAAETAAALGHVRWAELVCRAAQRRSKSVQLSEPLLAIRKHTASQQPLSIAEADVEHQRKLRQQFEVAVRTLDFNNVSPSSGSARPIQLQDVTASMELDFRYEYGHAPERWLMETLGGGVAVIDFDHDGWDDLYFAQAGRLSPTSPGDFQPCALFRNHSGQRFENVSAAAKANLRGYFHGCTVGDLNEDGFADLLLCGYGQSALLWNQGDGTWIDGTAPAGLTNDTWTTSASAVDLDRDGDLDLYQAAYCVAPLSDQLKTCREGAGFSSCRPNAYPPARDFLRENLGDGRFVERVAAAELEADRGYGLGVMATDFDLDGGADVFVGNDTTPNFLFWNAGRGLSLQESGMLAGVGVDGNGRAEACMGIACGDIDGNGLPDLFVTNFHDETPTLYVNRGQRSFEDVTDAAGLANPGQRLMGWGTQFVDLNLDGWLDVVTVNGHLHDTPQLAQVFRNDGGRFADVSASAADYFRQPRLGRSVAVGDFNRDGRDDLAISHQVEPATVLQTAEQTGACVRIRCSGTASARDATGTILRAKIGQRELVRLVSRQGGYLSSCSPEVTFGLDDATQIDRLEITWPNGSQERWENIPSGTQWLLREGKPPLTMSPNSN